MASSSRISIDALREIEKSILSKMNDSEPSISLIIIDLGLKSLCEALMAEPFGLSSLQFIDAIKDRVLFLDDIWLHIETYLVHAMHNDASENDDLAKLETMLIAKLSDINLRVRHRIFNPDFIRRICATDNEPLIQLFRKLLPTPTRTVFAGQALPRFVLEQEKTNTQHILGFLSEKTTEDVEKDVIKIQRQIRAHRRYEEEAERIPRVYSDWVGADKDIKAVIQEANTRYFPRCHDKHLAYRIFAASAQVNLFSTVKHLTSKKALTSILDDGLYGRKTLEHHYMTYSPAALAQIDVINGDQNAICLGPNTIDPKSKQKDSLAIVFDFKEIDHGNPCVFYKQRDLGYNTGNEKTINIGRLKLNFTHSGTRYMNKLRIAFSGFETVNYTTAYKDLPNYMFIAYDVEHIHQILTLNFFRFLDAISENGSAGAAFAKKLYSQIATLTDAELIEFLTELGKGMTQTAEFNFYGAHKIDIATIISFELEGYKLTMKDFIQQLEAGTIEALRTAQKNISPLFSSFRFLDYLLSTLSNKTVQAELEQLRKPCITPFWLEMKEKSLSADDVGVYQSYCQERAPSAGKKL